MELVLGGYKARNGSILRGLIRRKGGPRMGPGVRYFGEAPKCRIAIYGVRCQVSAFEIPAWLASSPKFGLRHLHPERANPPFP